jgi:hypothetical protein
MARTLLAIKKLTPAGVAPGLVAGNADGHSFVNDGRTWVEIDNASAGQVTATFQTPFSRDGLALAERTVDVPAGQSRLIGPFDPSVYNQDTVAERGRVLVDLSAVAGVSLGAFRLS